MVYVYARAAFVFNYKSKYILKPLKNKIKLNVELWLHFQEGHRPSAFTDEVEVAVRVAGGLRTRRMSTGDWGTNEQLHHSSQNPARKCTKT